MRFVGGYMETESKKVRILATVVFAVYLLLLCWLILFKLADSIDRIPHMRGINLIPFYFDRIAGSLFHIKDIVYNVAVFIPAGAYYVSTTMDELDQVKGQAFITSAITLGGVFSNLVSGVILDHLGIVVMLITGSVVCFVGVVIGYIAMNRMPHRTQTASSQPEHYTGE